MTEFVISAILTALQTPEVRKEILTLLGDVFLYIEHRRSADPNFIAQSDAAWAALQSAKTPEETLNARKAFQALQASSGA